MRSRVGWIATGLLLVAIGTAVLAGGGTARRRPRQSTPAPGRSTAPLQLVRTIVQRRAPARTHATLVQWSHGSWCWFGDPRAVHVGGPRGETFVGWIDWHGRITIGAYDPRFGLTRSHVVGRLAVDDHGSPSILVEPDRHLTVFWSGHGGPRMNYRTTRRAMDIGAWGPVHHIRSQLRGRLGFTYPNPVLLRDERDTLYLFWRGADWSQDYATRTSAGRWSHVHRLISVPGQRPYVKVDSNGADTIALAFTDGHPRGRITSVYYAAYRDGSLWSASGRRIAPLKDAPISPRQADLVYDGPASGVSAWVWDVALGDGAHPVIVYATFPSPRHHLYWYARWSGQRWISHLMTFAGPSISPRTIEREYSGGIALDHANPSIVYLSRKVGRWFEIERWTTRDGGYKWSYETVVRTRGADNVRPIVPRGSDGGPMSVLWLHGHYRGYRRYRTSISFLGSPG
jgi:BNR repeat-containing family member